jgi:hypothetical protein
MSIIPISGLNSAIHTGTWKHGNNQTKRDCGSSGPARRILAWNHRWPSGICFWKRSSLPPTVQPQNLESTGSAALRTPGQPQRPSSPDLLTRTEILTGLLSIHLPFILSKKKACLGRPLSKATNGMHSGCREKKGHAEDACRAMHPTCMHLAAGSRHCKHECCPERKSFIQARLLPGATPD